MFAAGSLRVVRLFTHLCAHVYSKVDLSASVCDDCGYEGICDALFLLRVWLGYWVRIEEHLKKERLRFCFSR